VTLPLPTRSVKANSGFTLVELLIALFVLAIILSFAVPNMRKMVLDNRVKSATNTLVGALHYARSEAIARNEPIPFCPAPEDESDATEPCGSTSDYKYGAQIHNDTFEFYYRTENLPNNIKVELGSGLDMDNFLIFDRNGSFYHAFTPHKTTRLFIANDNYDGIARTICIGQFGQIKTLEGTKAEGIKACP